MPDWEEILGRDGPAAWRTAYRIVGHRADADECFQEACLDALAIARREEVRHWRALLQRLAAARALDRLRARRRRQSREQTADWDALSGPDPGPSRVAEDAELAGQLRAALARINPGQAQVFVLHGLEGWSHDEIARHLAISPNAVGARLHRARAALRRLLSPAPDVAPTACRPREEPA